MNEYMLIYKGGDKNEMDDVTEEQMGAIMQKWGAWMEKLQKAGQLVSGGAPLDMEGKTLDEAGVVTDISTVEMKELVSGYSIIAAADIDAAIEIAKDCPIFTFPGKTIEVREVIQID